MCLVVVAHDAHPDRRLIVAGNRDEFHARPTEEARWWHDDVDIAGGRDLEAGGTWLAMHRNGRFATVTNYRGVDPPAGELPSRGQLVTGFLKSELPPLDYLYSLPGSRYAGFNLLVADNKTLAYCSNQGHAPRELPPGIYGLANTHLDAQGERISRSKERMRRLLNSGKVDVAALMGLLGNRDAASDDPLDAPFVVTPRFGTRCSTVVTVDRGGSWQLAERRFDPAGHATGESSIAENR